MADFSLNPVTSQASPGHVGMKLTVYGTGFIGGTKVTITYDDSTVEIATTDSDGNFRITFTIPPSVAGNHAITAIDGTAINSISELISYLGEHKSPGDEATLTLMRGKAKLELSMKLKA